MPEGPEGLRGRFGAQKAKLNSKKKVGRPSSSARAKLQLGGPVVFFFLVFGDGGVESGGSFLVGRFCWPSLGRSS